MRLASTCLACLMVLVLCFGPKACSQGIAWAHMLLTYVPEAGLIEGFHQTFSDERPCALCKSIEKSDPKKEPAAETKRQEHFTAPNNYHDLDSQSQSAARAEKYLTTIAPQCYLAIELPPPIAV